MQAGKGNWRTDVLWWVCECLGMRRCDEGCRRRLWMRVMLGSRAGRVWFVMSWSWCVLVSAGLWWSFQIFLLLKYSVEATLIPLKHSFFIVLPPHASVLLTELFLGWFRRLYRCIKIPPRESIINYYICLDKSDMKTFLLQTLLKCSYTNITSLEEGRRSSEHKLLEVQC